MDVLTCIKKYSEEDIKMMIKKITEATDDEMGFYMDALELLKNTLAENKYTLFVYVPEDENELMNINLFDTDEIVEKYHPIRLLDSVADPLSLDRKQAEAVLLLAAQLPKEHSLFEVSKEQIVGAEIDEYTAYRYGELQIIANIIISVASDEGQMTEEELDESMKKISDIFKEEDIEDASFSTELDLKSADEFMEYEADRAENSRQMAARSIAFYRAMGRKIENSKLGGGVQR